MPIDDNIALRQPRPVPDAGGFISPRRVRDVAVEACRIMTVKGRPEQPARALSGGNQQKVVIAKWLERKPQRRHPRRADPRHRRGRPRGDLRRDRRAWPRQGMAVIVVSSELEEVLGLSHRVLVLARGEQKGILDRGEATDVAVMHLAVG